MSGQVGFVGLGNMGWPMARNLRQAGVTLVVYDVNTDTASRFVDAFGGVVASTPGDFSPCEVVITMLPTDDVVRAAVLEWDGGIAAHLAPGSVVVDMSSSRPAGTLSLAKEVAQYGVRVVDAPVSGGVARAETAELSLMVGGEDVDIDKVRPFLEVLGARIFPTGQLGSGDAVKALNNFLAAANYAAAVEALRIGERFGVDAATLFEIVNTSTGRSFVTDVVIAGNVIPGTYATGFQLALLAKDVGIAEALAGELGLSGDSPVLELVNRRWHQAAGSAAPGTDHSAAHQQWWQRDGDAGAP